MAEASPPSQPECRICKSDVDPENTDQDSQLVSPCGCTGSMQFVHESCLKDLIDATKSDLCDFCSQKYNLPLQVVGYMTYNEWVKGDPRRVLILTGIVVVSAVLTLVGSLLFSWLTMFSILRRVIATGSLPIPCLSSAVDPAKCMRLSSPAVDPSSWPVP